MRPVEILRAVILGEPVAAPRPRTSKAGRHYVPRAYVAWRDSVALALRDAMVAQSGLLEPTPDPIRLELAFYRVSKRRVDVDNLAKGVMDAGNGVVWRDDFQIVRLTVGRDQVLLDPRTELIAYRLAAEDALPSAPAAAVP